MLTIYVAALAVICVCAGIAAIHPRIHTGIVGTAALGVLTLSSIAATETSAPARSTVGLAVSAAVVALWSLMKWRR